LVLGLLVLGLLVLGLLVLGLLVLGLLVLGLLVLGLLVLGLLVGLGGFGGAADGVGSCITTGSETTFLSALCVIRSPSYLVWSRTSLLGVGLADLGHFGRYFGQNKEIVGVFNGSVVYFNAGIGVTFLGKCCSTCQVTLLPAIF
jgi:hypothetical protein